ncbi:ribosomal RNA-processing protein 14-C-like [Humulus lupulus]|uniref:ribosomal RNA-processing protein 14-C-like n=1 Tax=Humulus lupulus TaxID=3486 RepID=UPI002B4075C0|nr:ribosomal RNA-processing protein 14-C-like [Humulus lupulus]XP_062110874.1 ribosomal RNA-processing protein 14-C-like [Humulus lupulus]XP_062110875.1 ribosomal RNA-processing protein 14-C-like [Humulus lupulus]XP_062110876.1 ribosomal RNA-processing protein 14-C-like [Humulus lupulus]XP_062110877.1 ribosomal RNA-processing protein 14-C-like [Humulus lupulus]XP_062110878.1 ribosomal RNA-processing protein 14-C-like [Humulus lupulus]XP_062110879.1 ribosomal RNA-processing protein 14-C-like [
MKKKRVKSGGESTTVVDSKSLIHQHSLFFDKLVELIPAKFYLSIDDKDKPWYQGLSKAQKASAKKEARENIKKARRNRLDPDKSSATTLDLLKESLEKEKKEVEIDAEDETETKPVLSGLDDDNRSVTYEELRQRLRRRIEEFQSSRNTAGSEPRITKRYERNERRSIEYKKRKRENEFGDKAAKTGISEKKVEKDVEEASKVLSFGHVKLSNDDEHEKKKRRLSKAKELERAKKLEEAKNDPEKGEIISKKHSWDAATSRAAGKKVHDDPKLLKQSLHKEKKRQQKNALKWKERVQTTEKLKSERQEKRSQNIEQKKQDKKTRRMAKREKKLMRPGFEGRKEGFINEKSA